MFNIDNPGAKLSKTEGVITMAPPTMHFRNGRSTWFVSTIWVCNVSFHSFFNYLSYFLFLVRKNSPSSAMFLKSSLIRVYFWFLRVWNLLVCGGLLWTNLVRVHDLSIYRSNSETVKHIILCRYVWRFERLIGSGKSCCVSQALVLPVT